ncbi:hypothetical protein PgNI_10461 [Pyricularia grisea]|uniref:Uncharacterized protein n=1 Tax=Pyricularia grisea TaxID=148305 RepID=A0A6P8AYJ4_PYRGI|nr:hypothetical protein PgNI_10461 [Pyricularia grisea]TLD07346.1 hypothetical protein PgNI_10461 [Pyricularia grisea]
MGRLVRPVPRAEEPSQASTAPKQPTFGTIPCLHLLLPPPLSAKLYLGCACWQWLGGL